MKELRNFLGIAALVFSSGALAEELLLDKWTQEIDQNVVQILGENPAGDGVLLLTKDFLDAGRGASYAERLDVEEYKLVDSNSAMALSLFTADRSENVIVGKSFLTNDKYVIPVVKRNATVDLYEYSPGSSPIGKISLGLDPATSYIVSAYALSDGAMVISAKDSGVVATYYPYGGQQTHVTLNLDESGATSRIVDVVELSGKVYMLAIIRSQSDSDSSNPLVVVFEQGRFSENIGEILFSGYSDTMVSAGFIATTESAPAVWITQQDTMFERPRLAIVSLGRSEVWSGTLQDIQGVANIDLVEACSEKYVYAEIHTTDTPATRRQLELGLIRSGASLSAVDDSFLSRESGTIVDLQLYASDDAVYAVTNYHKYEELRRSDGFHGWHGYNVFEVAKDQNCALDL